MFSFKELVAHKEGVCVEIFFDEDDEILNQKIEYLERAFYGFLGVLYYFLKNLKCHRENVEFYEHE